MKKIEMAESLGTVTHTHTHTSNLNEIKNNMKKWKLIIIIIVEMILASSLSVYATYNYLASNVSYTKTDGTKINLETALNDLYSIKAEQNVDIYPYQKFVLTKDVNGYVFTLKIYDSSNNEIYQTEYPCNIWGEFSSTTRTYAYNNKKYILEAHGSSSVNNFIGVLKCEGYDLFNVLGYSSRDNGSWDTNTTTIMKQRLKFQNVVYYSKD